MFTGNMVGLSLLLAVDKTEIKNSVLFQLNFFYTAQ